MPKIEAVITACDLVTGFGDGVNICWEGVSSGNTAIRRVGRFSTDSFKSGNAATVSGLVYSGEKSLVMQMLVPLLKRGSSVIPSDAALLVASTTGEIDILEKYVLEGVGDAQESRLNVLLEKVKASSGIKGPATIVSSACASASAALGFAASMIRNGKNDCVLVVAADAVTEFVFSGFSSLMALDPDTARPFDKKRAGLSLGEAAGFILLMARKRAEQEHRPVFGEIAGWAATNDANHMTGPSRDGSGLSLAIQKALGKAGVSPAEVGGISSHGTGTVYNDSMEMKAYKSVFKEPVPLYSIKGALGHTMGAAGLVETIIALKVLEKKIIPATAGLQDIDPEAENWVSTKTRALEKSVIMLNNAGFGGVNAALVLKL